MRLEINPFDEKSIQNAIDQLNAYNLEQKIKTLMERLGELGRVTADAGFRSVNYDGVNDVVVSVETTTDGIRVRANGQAVCFLEFGAGVRYGYGYSGKKPSGIVPIGTYGKGQGKNYEGWYIDPHTHTYGNEPAMAMLKARDAIVSQVIQIAREVFR